MREPQGPGRGPFTRLELETLATFNESTGRVIYRAGEGWEICLTYLSRKQAVDVCQAIMDAAAMGTVEGL